MNMDKLAKILSELSGYKRQGLISKDIFQNNIFQDSSLVSEYLWSYFKGKDGEKISEDDFVTGSEKVFTTITDKEQVQFYLKMFSNGGELLSQNSFMDLIRCAYVSYRLVYKMGNDESDLTSPNSVAWIETVNKSAYHLKQEMSIFFLTNWILTNAPRLLVPMHKYITYQLTTCYSRLKGGKSPEVLKNSNESDETPKSPENSSTTEEDPTAALIHPILMWLLRSSLPLRFLSVNQSNAKAGSPAKLMENLMLTDKPVYETWSLMYDSDDQGLSINRFQHHVFNYRGPTLMFVKGDNDYLFCIASDIEWRESCHFWGGEESLLLMVKPEFRVVERGAKLLYANFSIRGYPFGVQVGKDPRNLSIEIKPEFTYVSYKQIPVKLIRFISWGCAPPEVKDKQTDLRKWEAKQAEKNKKINLNNPEWKDNPDKYLLELAGSYKSYDNQ